MMSERYNQQMEWVAQPTYPLPVGVAEP
jgi:hypothetical protein